MVYVCPQTLTSFLGGLDFKNDFSLNDILEHFPELYLAFWGSPISHLSYAFKMVEVKVWEKQQRSPLLPLQ